jgi:molecular chaperone HscC
LLGSLKADAEAFLGETVNRAIISVPAYFNDIQRKATIAAGRMAGLQVERLVNEPTAAALAYGLIDKEGESTFLVIDLGGGTFDVSILEMFEGVMEVRSSAGDAFLGGEDFTDTLAEELARQAACKFQELSPKRAASLRDLADTAKARLSSEKTVSFTFADDKDKNHTLSIDREKFEEITTGLQKRLRHPIQRAMMDANLRSDSIDRIVLAGGATRMPIIRSLIARMFRTFPTHNLDPDHVIALGAAVQAGLVQRHQALEDVVMTDVCPFTLGTDVSVEVARGQYEHGHFQPIIERNTVIPVSRSNQHSALVVGQTSVDISVYQGEAPKVSHNIFLGKISAKLPRNMREREAIDIRFTYDVSGVLEVLLTVVSTQKVSKMIIEGNPGMLTKEEIAKRFQELEKIKIHPRDEAKNTALMARLEKAFENHIGDDRALVQVLIAEFERAMATQDEIRIREAREQILPLIQALEDRSVF